MELDINQPSAIIDSPSEKLVKIEDGVNVEVKPVPKSAEPKVSQKSDGNGKNGEKKCVNTVIVTEDFYGKYWDQKGTCHNIRRYTWKNKNKIQVQVINYGARITSMKLPDRKGDIEDIVLGFDDLGGYIYNRKYYIGATIGRMSNIVKNSTFQLKNKQYWLTPNYLDRHHINGGVTGLDQVVWKTYVDGTKVIMTHVSPHLSEGYPGDLFIKIIFQLSERNEFKVSMEAMCSEPTIVNLSNLTYFNLAGHHRGADEIYRHVVSLNCNCYTPQTDGFPTGEIQNVMYSQYDFQIPRLLGKLMGIVPKDGFNQNLCVNRGSDQEECFVGRVFHPPSGRMLEIYSNQCGVNFSTANEFGYGRLLSIQDIMPQNYECDDEFMNKDPLLNLMEKMHEKLIDNLKEDEKANFEEVRSLILKFKPTGAQPPPTDPPEPEAVELPQTQTDVEDTPSKLDISDFQYTTRQKRYLENMLNINCEDDDEEECLKLKGIAENILRYASHRQSIDGTSLAQQEQQGQADISAIQSVPKVKSAEKKPVRGNIIPGYYKKGNQIIGKSRKVYTMHGGIALQTQNYPDCANCKNFPDCRLYPGQTYTHSITYKFWIRAGNPNKWIKRNMNDTTKRA